MARPAPSCNNNGSEIQKKKRTRKQWVPDFPYNADYNDHFETPLVAYEEIAPLLDWLRNDGNTSSSRKEHIIYDPYYCNGQTTSLFHKLGFDGIINQKRDFYKDIEQDSIPEDFMTLVTNPPYSDQHKEKCLEFAFSQLRTRHKPFFLLMPNYVASREYYRTREDGDVVYLLPSTSEPYEYNHPEGTGKEIPPFASLWFCGIGKNRIQAAKDYWEQLQWEHPNGRTKPVLATSLDYLKESGAIPTQKRPNPRQRKKKRQHAQAQAHAVEAQQASPDSGGTSRHYPGSPSGTQGTGPSTDQLLAENAAKPSKKKSKYRNGGGQRQKKRF